MFVEVCQEPRATTFEFITLRLTTSLDILTDFTSMKLQLFKVQAPY